VWLVAAEGGEPRHLAEVPDASWLDWVDDDTLLVGTLAAEDGTIERVDVATGAVERLADHATAPAVAAGGERLHYLDRVVHDSDTEAGQRRTWGLATARLADDGLEPEGPPAALDIPFLYPYLGLSAGPCA
jgi:hypothetical protein